MTKMVLTMRKMITNQAYLFNNIEHNNSDQLLSRY